MAKKIEFESSVNPAGFHRGLALMERAAAASNEKMRQQVYAEERRNLARPISETFATGNGSMAGGRRRNFGASSSMFVSVARDSAASLASGAPITQVIAQQAPQVLQAFSMMNLGMVALKWSAYAVAAAIAGKILVALKNSYLMTNQIADGMVRIAAMADRLRMLSELRALTASLGLGTNAANLARQKSAADYDSAAADAAADLAKEKLKADFYAKNTIMTKEKELALEKQLLAIDEKRAQEKVTSAEQKMAEAVEVAKAQAELAAFNLKADQQYAADEAAIKKAEADNPLVRGIFSTEATKESRLKRAAAIAAATQQAEENKARLWEERQKAEKDLVEAQRRNGQGEIDAARANLLRIQNAMNAPQSPMTKTTAGRTLSSGGDSLVRIGNFLGSTRGKIEALTEKQVNILQRIEMNTRNLGGSSGAVYSP